VTARRVAERLQRRPVGEPLDQQQGHAVAEGPGGDVGHLVGDEDLEVEVVVALHVVGVDHDPVAEHPLGRARLDRRGGHGGHPREVAGADQLRGLLLVLGDEDHRLALPVTGQAASTWV
jgi:hypothetical protein